MRAGRLLETIDNMRAHVPDHSACSAAEPETIGGDPRGSDLLI